MKLITKKQKIKSIAKRWKEHYPVDKEGIYLSLKLIEPTEKEITNIIGNKTWTDNQCTECDKDVSKLISFREFPDYDNNTYYLCKTCLNKALKLIKQKEVIK